jgi:uncharacterized protein involved in outer membrane biogenesis
MKKLVMRLSLLGVALFVVLVIAVSVSVKPAARSAVEIGGAAALGVPTTLGGVQLGLGFGKSTVGLERLVIDNPAGFDGPAFLDLGAASMDLDTASLFRDTVRIPRINLTGLKLRVVQSGTDSNLVKIVQNLREQLDSGNAEEHEDAGDSESGGKGLIVDLIRIEGVQAEFDLRGVPGVAKVFQFRVPDFDIDLTEEGRAARKRRAEALIAEVVDALVKQSFLAANTEVPPEVAALLQGDLSLDSIVNRAQALLSAEVDEQKGKLEEKAYSELQDVADEHLPGGLEGLFGGGGL